ncbi:hypothetical protein LX73_1566 [Fodinibius salinus]|uniref:Uncharacterized protein n=1 Tax=Fodinibius salinus TaxID=860790 RepID=A0A5D3YJA4_9BACT|nr:hypothetical protein [Fodinibius salinus]TYP93853.1 hypothetical protein LX73_1566 [Fodinibius salinus]
MTFQEMVVALVVSIGAFALFGYLAAKTFGIIKAWINRNNSSIEEEQFNRLAKAFVEYKKDTTKRIEHLEAIIADEDTEQASANSPEIEAPKESIEIEDRETSKEQSSSKDDNNLQNMLRE